MLFSIKLTSDFFNKYLPLFCFCTSSNDNIGLTRGLGGRRFCTETLGRDSPLSKIYS